MENIENKIAALAKHLSIAPEQITFNGDYFDTEDGEEYFVFTDDEANEAAAREIKNSLWAFNANFILDCTELAAGDCCYGDVVESLQTMQNKCCESCNEFIYALIESTCGIDEFIERAIYEDGRGHFISYYDGMEDESEDYYIYRRS